MTPRQITRRRFPWRLLAWILPATPAGRSILGDLMEEHAVRPPGIRRTLWLLTATAQLCAAYLPARVAGGRPMRGSLRGLAADARATLRSLSGDRRPAAFAVLALAIGSGSVTSILNVMYGSLLQPLPFPDPETLVVLGDRPIDGPRDRIAGNISLPNVRDVVRAAPLIAAAAYRDVSLTLSGEGDARQVRAQDVEPSFFDVLRVPMVLGRSFGASDADEKVVVLSEALWRQRFGANAAVLGRTVWLDADPHVVVGVADTITQLGHPLLWRPLRPTAIMNRRNARQVYAVARLAPGLRPAAAAGELAARFDELRGLHPEIGSSRSIAVESMRDWLIGREGPRLIHLLAGVVAAVLVIASLNAALLMIVRTERRRHEFALRAALGAGRGRLLRLIVCEGLVLSLAGALLGLLFALWSTRLLVRLYGAAFPRFWEIELHPPVVAAALGLAAVTAFAISLLPAFRLRRSAWGRVEGLQRSQPLIGLGQRVLMAGQVALAVVFLVTGSLLVQSVWKLTSQDLGVRSRALLFDVSLSGRHRDSAAARPFVDTLLQRLRSLPGVTAAAAASRRPLFGGGNSNLVLPGPFAREGAALVEIRAVTPEYFSALGMRMVAGRPLADADARTGSPVVVNDAFARRYLPDGALERTFRVSGSDRDFTIVGVVSDIREFGPANPGRPTAYWPFGNGPYPSALGLTIMVSVADGDPMTLAPDARALLASLDRFVSLDDPVTLEELALTRAGRDRLAARALLLLAAAMAVTLTALGLYGVVSFSVAIRRREIGIRQALGSTEGAIVRLFVRQGLVHALPGIVLGLMAAAVAVRAVASYLYGVTTHDPVSFIAAAVGIAALAAGSSWFPARRAAGVHAAVVLLRE